MSSEHRQDFRNIVVLLVAQAFAAGVGIVAFFWIGGLFTTPELGRFSFAASLTVLFGLLAELGVRYVAIKAVALDPSCSRKLLRHSIVVRFILTGASLALLCLIAHFYPPWRCETRLLLLAGLFAATQFGADPITWLFFGKGRVDIGGMILILDRMLYVILLNVSALVWRSAESLMLAAILANVLRTAIGWIWLRPHLAEAPQSPGWDMALFQRLITEGLAIGFAIILSVAYTGISIVVAQSLTTAEELGIYAIAFGLVSILLVIPMALTNALFPALARASAPGEIRGLYSMMVKLFLLITVPMTAFLIIFRAPLLTFWVGGRYEAAIELLGILALGLFASCFNFLYRIFLFAYNRHHTETVIDLVGIVLFICLGVILRGQLNALRIAMIYTLLEWSLLLTKVLVTRAWLGDIPHKSLFLRIIVITAAASFLILPWIGSVRLQVILWPAVLLLLMLLTNIIPLTLIRGCFWRVRRAIA